MTPQGGQGSSGATISDAKEEERIGQPAGADTAPSGKRVDSHGKASTTCCAVHCAVALVVTSKWTARRRSCASTRNQFLHVAVDPRPAEASTTRPPSPEPQLEEANRVLAKDRADLCAGRPGGETHSRLAGTWQASELVIRHWLSKTE